MKVWRQQGSPCGFTFSKAVFPPSGLKKQKSPFVHLISLAESFMNMRMRCLNDPSLLRCHWVGSIRRSFQGVIAGGGLVLACVLPLSELHQRIVRSLKNVILSG